MVQMILRLSVSATVGLLALALAGCGGSGAGETCSDGARNQNETDVDCGGVCEPCAQGESCLVDGDCTTGNCDNGSCGPETEPSCSDGEQNQNETDIDCGGVCDPCAAGQACRINGDCASLMCDNGTCAAAPEETCDDGEQNQDETDVDCGGSVCDPCPLQADCEQDGDCASGFCDAGSCAPFDECAAPETNDCDPNASCTDRDAGYDCTCNDGFEGDGFSCSDIDECADAELNDCGQNADCVNIDGGFECVCSEGYSGDGYECSNIDECADPELNECHAHASCTDLEGSYECTCNEDFTGDGFTCLYDFCGDGLVDEVEICDDGNNEPDDGVADFCAADCMSHSWPCGDWPGVVPAAFPEWVAFSDQSIAGSQTLYAVVDHDQVFQVAGHYDYDATATGCEGCVNQLYWGLFAGPAPADAADPDVGIEQGCVSFAGSESADYTFDFNAPTRGGTYYLRWRRHWNYDCDDAHIGELGHDNDLAAICVIGACGDGVLDRGEACDDGNNAPENGIDDFCAADCSSHSWPCGDWPERIPTETPAWLSFAATSVAQSTTGYAVVQAGSEFDVSGHYDYDAEATGCPGCVNQLYWGLLAGAPPATNDDPYAGIEQGCVSFTGSNAADYGYTFTAPETGGTYYLRWRRHWNYSCDDAHIGTPGSNANLSAVCVVE